MAEYQKINYLQSVIHQYENLKKDIFRVINNWYITIAECNITNIKIDNNGNVLVEFEFFDTSRDHFRKNILFPVDWFDLSDEDLKDEIYKNK